MAHLTFTAGNSDKINLDLSFIGPLIEDLLVQSSDVDKVSFDELIFYGDPELETDDLTLDLIIKHKASLFDVFLANSLIKEGKTIKWIERTDVWNYKDNHYQWSLLTIYFMLMTRDKITLSENENLPNIIAKNKPSNLSYNNMIEILSSNNLEKMNHNWIFKIKISKLGSFIGNRLLKGIAGSRLYNAIINYPHKENISENSKKFINKLRTLISNDVFKELHTKGQPDSIKSRGLAKNLNNFILENFDDSVIKKMVKDHALYSIPQWIQGYEQYKTWDDTFLDYLKTSLK